LSEISNEEVVELLLRVARGEVTPRLESSERSWDVYFGNVGFIVDGWTVVVYNDCDSFDYLDTVTAPDGREVDFDDMYPAGFGGPDEQIDAELFALIERAFREAKYE
jgi:hypothetical protein